MKKLDIIGKIRELNANSKLRDCSLQNELRKKIYHLCPVEVWNMSSKTSIGRLILFITIHSGLDNKIIQYLCYEKEYVKENESIYT